MESVAIIGAGISGVSTGRMLKEKGIHVDIFEKNEKPGGLVRCDWIDGNLFHKVGGHVFNSKNERVLKWFWSYFDRDQEFTLARRNAKVFFQNKYIRYPIENHIYQLDQHLADKVFEEIEQLQKTRKVDESELQNFEDFLRIQFGDTLFQLYFKPYNKKIWNVPLASIPLDWLEGKLPMPDYQRIIRNNRERVLESDMVHSQFYYPKKGGSQFIIDRLAAGLSIHTNCEIGKLQFDGGSWKVDEKGGYDTLIFTGDIRKLPGMLSGGIGRTLSDEMKEGIKGLRSNGTSNVLCYTDETDLSWLYLPEESTRAHRIIYTGNFSDQNNSTNARPTCVVEFSGKHSVEVMKNEIRKLPGNLQFLGANYEPNSYVIQDPGTRKVIKKVKEKLANVNLYLCGRFAEWEYYNMDKAIEASAKVCDYEGI